MKNTEFSALSALQYDALDRSSFVPLYYQLQEVLKQHMESECWKPGDLLPSEPDLARHFGVSRVVVRQALAILADDNQIQRVRGRGTFVAPPKTVHRAAGLSRLLATPREPGVRILVLDISTNGADEGAREYLDVSKDEPLVRVTTQLMADDAPFAIIYSTFKRSDVSWLTGALHPGRPIAEGLTMPDQEFTLAHSESVIETSQCGQFEADRFEIPYRSPVFLVHCTEYCRTIDAARPFEPWTTVRPLEVARGEYRGDNVRLKVQG